MSPAHALPTDVRHDPLLPAQSAQALSVFSPSCIEHVILITSELDMAQCVPGMEVATDTEFVRIVFLCVFLKVKYCHA